MKTKEELLKMIAEGKAYHAIREIQKYGFSIAPSITQPIMDFYELRWSMKARGEEFSRFEYAQHIEKIEYPLRRLIELITNEL